MRFTVTSKTNARRWPALCASSDCWRARRADLVSAAGRRTFVLSSHSPRDITSPSLIRSTLMRTEVHVHGSVFLCKGVRLSQVDQAMRPWLDYLDVDTVADAHSLEREE